MAEDRDSVTPVAATLWGLGRTLSYEHAEFECTRVDLDPLHPDRSVTNLVEELMANSADDEVAWRTDARYIAELKPYSPQLSRDEISTSADQQTFRLEVGTPGMLDRLTLRPSHLPTLGANDVEIAVDHAGVNFVDIMKAMGFSFNAGGESKSTLLGGEYAGRIVALGSAVRGLDIGQDVLAVAPASFASHVVAPADLVQPRPRTLSSEQAATIPLVFMTAWHALCEIGRLGPGERILIHSAAGGTGLAAVRLAQRIGAELFATAGSE
ncbi:MAG: alcohol dehydrogenase catalytic domain-containing protein, partial [Myxococcota bacterium]